MLYHALWTILGIFAQEDVPVVEPVLRNIINHHLPQSHHFVLILRDMEIRNTLLPDQPARYIIHDKAPIRIEPTRGFLVFQGGLNLSEILNITQWTSRTRFLIVQPRIRTMDDFIVNFKHQAHSNESLIMTRDELVRDFNNSILEESEESDITWRETKHILREFWSNRIQHVVVLIPQKTNVYFYTFFPFTENHCQDEIAPTLVNVWSSSVHEFYKRPNFYPGKLVNLFGCPLNVSVTEVPPGLMLKERATLDGIEGQLIIEILSRLNATPLLLIKQDPKWFGKFSAMDHLFRDVTSGGSDIGAGLLLPTFTEKNTDDVNFCTTVCLSWAVPNHLEPKSAFLVMADVFNNTVWYCVGYSIIASLLVWAAIAQTQDNGRSYDEVFKIFRIVFGQSALRPRPMALKLLFVHFLWFVVWFSTVYQAGFGSNRIVLQPVHRLKTSRDVLESGIDLAGSFTAKQIFDQRFSEVDEFGKKIAIRAMDTQNGLIKVAYERKTAFLGIRLTSKYVTRVIKPDLRDLVFLQEDCLMQYHPALAFKHSSPYTAVAETTVQTLVEAGIVDHAMKLFMSRVNYVGESSNRRRVRRRPPPSVALALATIIKYGLGFSLFVFLAEHISYYMKRRGQGLWGHH